MKVTLERIEGSGVLDRERVVLRVQADVDLGDFAVLRCDGATDDGKPLAGAFEAGYWFNLFPVKAGDLVVLYSKEGTTRQKAIGDGKTSHFFYWGYSASIWTANKVAVLLQAPEWMSTDEDEATNEPQDAEEKSK